MAQDGHCISFVQRQSLHRGMRFKLLIQESTKPIIKASLTKVMPQSWITRCGQARLVLQDLTKRILNPLSQAPKARVAKKVKLPERRADILQQAYLLIYQRIVFFLDLV